MTVQVEFWHLVGLALTLMGGFWTLAKMLIAAGHKHTDDRFERILKSLEDMRQSQRAGAEELRRIDRELMALRAELPEKYVIRDDFVRYMGEVRLAIDALALRFENVLLRGKK